METMINDFSVKLKQLNSRRISLFLLNILVVAAFTVVYFKIAFYLQDHFNISGRIVRYGVLPLVYFLYYYLKKKKDAFNRLYDEVIIGDLMHSCYPDWRYDHEARIDTETVYRSCLVNKGSTMDVMNNISGNIGKTDFDFAEIKILKNQYAGAHLPKKLFHGYFFIFNNNKYIESRLFVRPRVLKDFGNKDFKEKKIMTDTSEFDSRFTTFSNDPLKARYILTPALMARMIDFENKYQDMVSFLFEKDKLYIAIKGNKNYLEPSLHRRITADTINKQMDVFALIGKIVEELNMGNDIWIKENAVQGGVECV